MEKPKVEKLPSIIFRNICPHKKLFLFLCVCVCKGWVSSFGVKIVPIISPQKSFFTYNKITRKIQQLRKVFTLKNCSIDHTDNLSLDEH